VDFSLKNLGDMSSKASSGFYKTQRALIEVFTSAATEVEPTTSRLK